MEAKYSVKATDIIDGTGEKAESADDLEVQSVESGEAEEAGGEEEEDEEVEAESGEEEESGDDAEEEEEEEEVEEVEEKTEEPESNSPEPIKEEHPILLEEDELLEDFDRIYPVPLAKQHIKHPNYAALKAFVFEKDVKQQLRLKAPLQQRKSAAAADYEMYTPHSGFGKDYHGSRADSWITGNAFGRKVSDAPSAASTPKAAPTAKQVEAADRLSRGFSTKEKKKAPQEAGGDNSWYLSERVLKAAANAKEQRKRIEINAQKSAEVAVKPVVFDFTNDFAGSNTAFGAPQGGLGGGIGAGGMGGGGSNGLSSGQNLKIALDSVGSNNYKFR